MDIEKKISARCWAADGIWGNADCPELSRVGHCHNCEVYVRAGRDFLDRARRDKEGGVLASDAGAPEASFIPSADAVVEKESSFLLFKCSGFNFALPMEVVREIANSRSIHRIPHRSDGVLAGLSNINGELVIVVDILKLMDLGESKKEDCKMVVCYYGDNEFAFNADFVWGVARVGESRISPFEAEKPYAVFISGEFSHGGQKYLLIDCELFFHALTRKYL